MIFMKNTSGTVHSTCFAGNQIIHNYFEIPTEKPVLKKKLVNFFPRTKKAQNVRITYSNIYQLR
jgi:hypothetical protein